MLDNRTIGDSVYEKIKYDIVHLTLKPGEKLPSRRNMALVRRPFASLCVNCRKKA